MPDAEDPRLAVAERLEPRMERKELRQAVADLPRVAHGRWLLDRSREPDVAHGLEQPSGHPHLVVPRRRQVDVVEQAAVEELPEEREPPLLPVARYDLRHEAGHDAVPRFHLSDLRVDLPLGALLPDHRFALAD